MIATAYNLIAMPLALSADERWGALQRIGEFNGRDVVGWLFYGAAGLVIVAMVTLLVMRRREQKRRQWQSFEADAQHAGLSHAEQELLMVMSNLASLRRPEVIFSIEQAFDRGASRLKESPRVLAMPLEKREHVAAMVTTISQKLGYTPLPKAAPASVNTNQIEPGSLLSITPEGSDREYDLTVAENGETEMLAEAATELDIVAGSRVTVHYSNLGTVWEFETEAVAVEGRLIRLRQTNHIRFINRRRFPRIETMREALAARFEFFQDGHDMQEPQFVNAILVEIAGPGLLLEVPLTATLNDKMLVVVMFDIDRVIQGLGKVRRVTPIDSQRNQIALELMDLKPDEIAELARQTNAAAQKKARTNQQQEALAASAG